MLVFFNHEQWNYPQPQYNAHYSIIIIYSNYYYPSENYCTSSWEHELGPFTKPEWEEKSQRLSQFDDFG